MTQEDKELLLKDLCARLPYGVRGKVKAGTVVPHKYDIDGFPLETTFDVDVELQRIDVGNNEIFVSTFDDNEDLGNYIQDYQIDGFPWTIEEFDPYLRPMSSMTEEEIVEIESMGFAVWGPMINNDLRTKGPMSLLDAIITHHKMAKLIDWLNAHHFDYHGLIEKGLALEAPEGMYN